MPYLSDEARTLTEDRLIAGVADTFLQQRFATLAGRLPFVSTENSGNNWVIETGRPSGTSAHNPYSTNVASGTGARQKIEVDTGQLARNADTPMKDINSGGPEHENRAVYRGSAAKRLAYDFEDEMINGMGLDPHVHGLEYFLTKYAGFARPNGNHAQMNSSDPLFEHRKVFWADNPNTGDFVYTHPPEPGNSNHSRLPFSMEALDELIDRDGGMMWDALLTTRQGWKWIRQLYRLQGNDEMEIYFDEDFGQRVFAYEGIPIMRLDHSLEDVDNVGVGAAKHARPDNNYGVTVSSGSNVELTVADPGTDADDDFKGFNDLDVGRTITLDPDGSGNGSETATIVAVKDRRTVDLDSVSNSHTDEDATVGREPAVIYAIKFGMDTQTGFNALYNPVQADDDNLSPGGTAQSIVGFRAKDVGELQDGGRFKRDKLDWYGTFSARSIHSLARLSHFDAPDTP